MKRVQNERRKGKKRREIVFWLNGNDIFIISQSYFSNKLCNQTKIQEKLKSLFEAIFENIFS